MGDQLFSQYWAAPRGLPKLGDDEVQVWRVDLDRNMEGLGIFKKILATGELQKASRFRAESDGNRYIVARAALRCILGQYLNTSPGELIFRYGSKGKPELKECPVKFNLSHSDGLALCVISSRYEVGIDVERIRSAVTEDVAAWFFPARTVRLLEALPQPVRKRTFLQGWTRMEAYSKARGDGLVPSLEYFDQFLWRRASGSLRSDQTRWWFHDFCPRRGYIAAIAARGRRCRLKYWNWRSPDSGS